MERRLGWEYNVKKRIWDRNADLNVEGVRTMISIYAEQNNLKAFAAAAVEIHRPQLS
jgi:hypothetical protein